MVIPSVWMPTALPRAGNGVSRIWIMAVAFHSVSSKGWWGPASCECRPLDNDGDGTTAGRALVLGAAGHVKVGHTKDAGEHAADEGTGMTGAGNVGIVEHGV